MSEYFLATGLEGFIRTMFLTANVVFSWFPYIVRPFFFNVLWEEWYKTLSGGVVCSVFYVKATRVLMTEIASYEPWHILIHWKWGVQQTPGKYVHDFLDCLKNFKPMEWCFYFLHSPWDLGFTKAFSALVSLIKLARPTWSRIHYYSLKCCWKNQTDGQAKYLRFHLGCGEWCKGWACRGEMLSLIKVEKEKHRRRRDDWPQASLSFFLLFGLFFKSHPCSRNGELYAPLAKVCALSCCPLFGPFA